MKGSQIYIRGRHNTRTPLAEKFSYLERVVALSKCVYNFDFLALVDSEI